MSRSNCHSQREGNRSSSRHPTVVRSPESSLLPSTPGTHLTPLFVHLAASLLWPGFLVCTLRVLTPETVGPRACRAWVANVGSRLDGAMRWTWVVASMNSGMLAGDMWRKVSVGAAPFSGMHSTRNKTWQTPARCKKTSDLVSVFADVKNIRGLGKTCGSSTPLYCTPFYGFTQ